MTDYQPPAVQAPAWWENFRWLFEDRGDTVYALAEGIPTNLPIGVAGQVLTVDPVTLLPIWANAVSSSSNAVPIVIHTGEEFVVLDNTQVLYAYPITVDGTLTIDGTGVLVGVN